MLVSAVSTPPPVRAPAPQAASDAASARREESRAQTARSQGPQAAAPGGGPGPADLSLKTPSEYRLVYDDEFSRIFVQVVDRSSGEEILRFPPEELVRFIDNSIERANSRVTSGLILDRLI